MSERQLQPAVGLWGGVVFLAALAYGIAYVLTVVPITVVDEAHLGILISGRVEPFYCADRSKIGQWSDRAMQLVFTPRNWLDRKIRPAVWEIHSLPRRTSLNWRDLT